MLETMKELLVRVVQTGASDLHLIAGVPPQFRVDGSLKFNTYESLTPKDCQNLIYSLLTEDQVAVFEKQKELDLSLGIEGLGRFRINIYKQRGTVGAAIRLISIRIPSFEELGLPVGVVKGLAERKEGLILVSGAAGMGKSTTLAAMIDYINSTRRCHIVSIEDPIEYLHKHKESVVSQREIGEDTRSFSEAIKRTLRQDPNVILIGEMRDLETIESALVIAETGHLVLSTLHTGGAATAISRLIDVFPIHQREQVRMQISLNLLGVIVQQLLPKANDKGRVLAMEVMIVNPAIQNLIREGHLEQIYSVIQTSSKEGMCTINRSLFELYKKGQITSEMALSKASNPKEVLYLMERDKESSHPAKSKFVLR